MRKVDPGKHEEKRREILEAAGRCFARDGFQGASISTICGEAGISPGHLYHYFANKEAVINAMAETRLKEMTAHFSSLPDKDAVSAMLDQVCRGISRKGAGQPMLLEMLAEAVRNPVMAKVLEERSRGFRDLITSILRKGQDSGHVDRNLDPRLAASVLISMIDGSKTLMLREPKLDLKKAQRR